jgi:radical SAM protein with 4Fe4S-binding SPASM domain
MRCYLSKRAVIKWLETPSVYQIAKDELHELDQDSFLFLQNCAGEDGCTSRDGAFIDYCIDEGLLTTEHVQQHRPPIVQAPMPSLRYLELQITSACDLRCRHCYLGDRRASELPVQLVHRVLTEFEQMQGLRVMITGGEPVLHSGFDEINNMLPDFMLRKVLFTNGVQFKKERLRTLKVDEIQVSIDGLEKAHDAVRGPGTFERSMQTIKLALDAGFDVSIATMVHTGNLGDFDALDTMFRSMGIKDWTVDVPCITGRLESNAGLQVSPELGGKYLGYGYGDGLHSSDPGYGCGLHLMAVMADGTAAKCSFYGDRGVGNVAEGLAVCWSRIVPIRLSELACSCEYREACRGGCRYRAELINGPRGKDLYRCRLYGILDEKS